jgi:hypothetical protein
MVAMRGLLKRAHRCALMDTVHHTLFGWYGWNGVVGAVRELPPTDSLLGRFVNRTLLVHTEGVLFCVLDGETVHRRSHGHQVNRISSTAVVS